jgi:hypothetical protein
MEEKEVDVAAIAAKVAALLAKANDPAATPEERLAFSNKATELMVKYEIDSMTLDAGKNGEVPVVFGQFRIHTLNDRFVPYERVMLAGSIARNFECRGVIHTYHGMRKDFDGVTEIPPGEYYEVVGYKGDFEITAVMFFHLSQYMMARILMETGKQVFKGKGAREEKVRFERSIASGCVAEIDDRLKAMHRRVNDWQPGDGVSDSVAVAIRSRLERVQEKFFEKYPKGSLGTMRVKSLSTNYEAYQKGRAIGRSADLGGGKLGGVGSHGEIGGERRGLNRG